MTSLSQVHDDESEDQKSNNCVDSGTGVTQVLARQKDRRDNGGNETNDQRQMDGPAISGDRIAMRNSFSLIGQGLLPMLSTGPNESVSIRTPQLARFRRRAYERPNSLVSKSNRQ